jgi:deoxyribonuclease-4
LRLGIHTFTSGGLERAAITAAELGANTFQIFSSSPRMWRASLPDPAQVKLLRAARDRFDLRPLVIHVNYLVNLASCDPVIRSRSVAAFRGEIDRALAIGAEFLVLHPGSYRNSTPEQGMEAFAEGLRDAAHGVRTAGLTVLIENTAGAGCHLGSRFEELRTMRALAAEQTDVAVGFCLDTCHLIAAGFDITTQAGLRAMLKQADATFGLDNVHVIHANDSKCPLGSNADRHQHIGKGHIGREAFHRILTCKALRAKPFILETPIDEEGDDRRNLDMLKLLAKRGPLSRP